MRKLTFIIFLFLMIISLGILCSCIGQQGPVGPQGEQGVQGEPGKDGHTPKVTIGENGNWYIDGVDTGVCAEGAKGKDGNDGQTPYIGENGNWWIGETDTEVKATIEVDEDTGYILASDYGINPGNVDSNMLQRIIDDLSLENKTILFKDGEYCFSATIDLNSNVTLIGNANTVFKLDEASLSNVLINIKEDDNVNIKNLAIVGSNISRPTQKGKKCGVWVESSRSVNIENVDICGWDLYGLYGKTMSSYGTAEQGKFYKQLQLLNTRFYYNYYGSYYDYRCEYTQTLNCVYGENYIGSVNCGGNNLYTSCMWNSNYYGFILNNDGSNPAHGGCNSSTFNHNEIAIQVNNCVNGWTFDACQIFYGKIELKNSIGVIFNSNIWGSCYFYSLNPGNINKNLISNTYFLTNSFTILANNDGSTLVYCCLPDHLPNDIENSVSQNIIDDFNWTELIHTANGIHPGASNCYFSNCSTPVDANSKITNLYIVINGANYNSVVNGVNVWLVNGDSNKVEEKLVDNKNLSVAYSKRLGKYVLNIEINAVYDFPVYFVAQAIRENGVGIAYSHGASNSEFLDTNEVTIGQTITPNSKIVAEFVVCQSK